MKYKSKLVEITLREHLSNAGKASHKALKQKLGNVKYLEELHKRARNGGKMGKGKKKSKLSTVI